MACAASATISGVRLPAMPSAPPTMFCTAAVAINVRGHRQLAAMPASRWDSATPSVSIVIAYLLTVYGAWSRSQRRSMFSGGDSVRHVRVRAGAEVGQCGAGQQERAARVDVEHQVIALGRQLADVLQRDRRCVVDDDVDGTEAAHGGLDGAGDRLVVADVAEQRQGWPPAASISSAAVWIVPGRRGSGVSVFAISATFAPSRAARTAIASPIPRLPPDMRMVRPASVPSATARILPRRPDQRRSRCTGSRSFGRGSDDQSIGIS